MEDEKSPATKRRIRTAEEQNLLAAEYKKLSLRRVACSGQHRSWDPLFTKFFVSSTDNIPKKNVIGQPQKWRLIHYLSSRRSGKQISTYAGINGDDSPVTYPSILRAAHVLCRLVPRGCVVWGSDLKDYYRHLMINPAYCWCTGTTLNGKFSLTATALLEPVRCPQWSGACQTPLEW